MAFKIDVFTDIYQHFKELNGKLQGTNKTINVMINFIRGFTIITKSELFEGMSFEHKNSSSYSDRRNIQNEDVVVSKINTDKEVRTFFFHFKLSINIKISRLSK